MKKASKIADIIMGVTAVLFLISAVVHAVHGENQEVRMDLLWSVVCVVNLRVSTLGSVYESLNDVVGEMIELLGVMIGVKRDD